MENLIELYQYNLSQFPKEEIIEYFIERNPDALTTIFNYDSEMISYLQRMYAAEKKVVELKKFNSELLDHINLSPDGAEYLKIRAIWYDRLKN